MNTTRIQLAVLALALLIAAPGRADTKLRFFLRGTDLRNAQIATATDVSSIDIQALPNRKVGPSTAYSLRMIHLPTHGLVTEYPLFPGRVLKKGKVLTSGPDGSLWKVTDKTEAWDEVTIYSQKDCYWELYSYIDGREIPLPNPKKQTVLKTTYEGTVLPKGEKCNRGQLAIPFPNDRIKCMYCTSVSCDTPGAQQACGTTCKAATVTCSAGFDPTPWGCVKSGLE